MNALPQTDLGPYRLQQLLSRGGMGAVYVARDPRLGRRVALKHILPETIGDPRRRQRFRREAAILARLSHPAIVQIFDVVDAPDGDWIVMELVEGETVAQLLTEGPVPIRQAVTIGRQVAEGLAEAHAQGILHRDLKTENVIVSRTGHAKILDFGVAKQLWEEDGETTLSESGQIVGTYRAMSPEQTRSLPLDPRSDLFSLGVLLYEMTTAVAPFQGATLLDTLTQITSRPHVPVRRRRGEVPERLSGLVDRLLEKSPELRPGSARRVAAALSGLEAGMEESTSGDARGRGSGDVEPMRVPEPGAAPTGEAVATWRRRVRPALLILAALAMAVAVLKRETWQSRLVPSPSPDPPAAAADVVEPDSYALFQQGMAYLERYDKPGHLDRAAAAFEAALARQESSAPAHAGLALVYWREYRSSRDPLRLEQALSVAERAVRLDGHLALARVAVGNIYAQAGRHEDALRELTAALQLEPSNAGAYRGLGEVHERHSRLEEATRAYEKAVELEPEDHTHRDQLAMAYYRLARYDEAEAEVLRSIELAPDGVYGYRNLSAVYYMQSRLPEAAEALQKALEIKPEHSLYSNLGTIFFAQGLYQPSAGAFEKALEHGGAHFYLYWANLADAYRFTEGHEEKAREAYLQAIRLIGAELERSRKTSVRLRSRLALYRAKRGDREEALAELGKIAQIEESEAADLYRIAVVYEVCGEREKALTALAGALRAGFSLQETRRDPELFDLRSDPRYQRLTMELDKI